MEERNYLENQRTNSPHSSEFTSRLGRGDSTATLGLGSVAGGKKIRGLENIYLQRFEKRKGTAGPHSGHVTRKVKPKFR